MCKRKDGKKLKHCDPILNMTTYIMPYRFDAQVFSKNKIRCEKIDEFIREENEKGIKFNYMHVVIAGLVRMYALRPKMNRFIMNRKVYARNNISICFAIKKSLKESAPETTLKIEFTGLESIYEVKEKIDNAIEENCKVTDKNDTDKMAKKLLKLPNFFLKFVMKFLRFLDNHGMLSKKLIALSPFHATCFLTNMKSLGSEYVYHHIYDFGTNSQFLSMGKSHLEPIVDEYDNISIAKIMKMGMVIDERICDGFYYAKGIKIGTKYIENPSLLREPLDKIVVDDEI